MSIQNVHTFLAKLNDSPELEEKIARLSNDSEITAEDLAKLSLETDTPFTAEEFTHVSEKLQSELSDDALATVSGGLEPGMEFDNRSSSQLVIDKLKSLGKYREKTTSSFEIVDPRFIKPPGAANPS